MKTEITKKVTVNAKTIKVSAGVRYWEDGEVNGIEDESGDLIPCRNGDKWEPIIDIDTGKITNWEIGTNASIHYKVCDECSYEILDENNEVILKQEEDYVPGFLCPDENGYGDYIIMDISHDGSIKKWNFKMPKKD